MKKSRGFTLVEIVIVIAIVGLLMVVLVPSISSSWKTNTMKAARLQAERVAKSVRVGIYSEDIDTSTTSITNYTGYAETNKINPTLNPINYIGGIITLYDEPNTNEDIVDPTSDASNHQDKIFKIAYDSNGKIVIFRAKANVSKSIDENAEWKLYYEE